MTHAEQRAILAQITYKPGWSILATHNAYTEVMSVQIAVSIESDATLDSAARDGSRVAWKSGKRALSAHMCRQEIVGVIFSLIQDAEMHELREWFRYRNASIYNPHLDPDVLADVARKLSSFNVRANAMTMAEEPTKEAA